MVKKCCNKLDKISDVKTKKNKQQNRRRTSVVYLQQNRKTEVMPIGARRHDRSEAFGEKKVGGFKFGEGGWIPGRSDAQGTRNAHESRIR